MTSTGALQPKESSKPIRVLVVDDSAFMRYTITKHLSGVEGIQVVASARDGDEALSLIPKVHPDVVTLDVEMPHRDDISTLRDIMTQNPIPVVMLSSLTAEGTVETVQALTLGAVDFVAKPSNKANINAVMDDVVSKIYKAARTRVYSLARQTSRNVLPEVSKQKNTRRISQGDKLIIIGSSTGGPRALNAVIPDLSASLNAAILIVQHMPVGFTRSLAERLDSISHIRVKEAEPGDKPEIGKALLAPGGFHMTLDRNGEIQLDQNPPVHGVRPAIDVTVASAVNLFGKSCVSVILTGMGSDGTSGSMLVKDAGGYVIAEDESTCVVWGMPRSVFEAGITDEVLPLTEIPAAINRLTLPGT